MHLVGTMPFVRCFHSIQFNLNELAEYYAFQSMNARPFFACLSLTEINLHAWDRSCFSLWIQAFFIGSFGYYLFGFSGERDQNICKPKSHSQSPWFIGVENLKKKTLIQISCTAGPLQAIFIFNYQQINWKSTNKLYQ